MIARDVIEDVRAACERTGRPTTTQEVQTALAELGRDELERIRLLARGGFDASPLGPDAIVDVLYGTDPTIAAARELTGYYEQAAEREALAAIKGSRRSVIRDEDDEAADYTDAAAEAADAYASVEDDVEPRRDSDDDDAHEAPAPPDALKGERVRLQKPRTQKERSSEADELLTLFAYHRDNVLVAQSLGVGLVELSERVEHLGLWRSIQRMLERTTDIDVFSPGRVVAPKSSGVTAPVLRKRGEKPAPTPEEPSQRGPASEGPAADTEPVNSFGTRVYRRTEERRPAPVPVATTPAPRREYVREAKRPVRHVEKPQKSERVPLPTPAPVVPEKKPFSELQATQGKATLERLISDEKANPRVLAAKLAERFEGPGRDVNESDLRQLLKHHGLLGTFEEREVTNTRFLIGFHQGARAKLLNALQMSADEVDRYLARTGLSAELERVRAERSRIELGRKKLSDRITQVLTRAPYLDDLGILGTVDTEVREALTEQFATVEKNGASGPAAAEAVRSELGLEPNPFAKLLKRYDLSAKLG